MRLVADGLGQKYILAIGGRSNGKIVGDREGEGEGMCDIFKKL